MDFEQLSILTEPFLVFRHGQKMQDPHDGLALFGPCDADNPSHSKGITYGVIGTPEGIDAFKNWSEKIIRPILTEDYLENRLWPHFPGFEAAFSTTWPKMPAWSYSLNRQELLLAANNKDANKRAYDVVNMYLEGFILSKKKDESFDILICVIPDEIWKNCRPQSKVVDGIGYSVSKKEREVRTVQPNLYDEYDPFQYQLSVDFRRQLKARSMEYDIPLQIIRESTIECYLGDTNKRGLTPASDRAWNLSTAFYYKSGSKPWRLHSAREGVCYIGIAFRREDPFGNSRTACCAAQMFLDSGDGIVFLGEYGPWYSPEYKQFHLTKDAANKLLSGVLDTYYQLQGKRLTEIFFHSRSSISNEEFEGYMEACPKGVRIVGVKVRLDRYKGLRLYREGDFVVMRGTFWKINEYTGFLFASGFKPRLQTYDGWEVPIPLRINIEHGDADIKQVATDIFGLTKLNYNSCKLGESQPVTVHFSDAVGEILVSNPTVKHRRPNFKFYI